ncbi:MAG: hypothetical protein WCK49_03380 [Myxococcaceae bacterium]
MAQIIKGTEKPTPPVRKSLIMKGSLYREQQEVDALYAQAEIDIKNIVSKAKKDVAAAKEQAMTEGANQAFAEASSQALDIFIERTQYCLDLKNQLGQLTQEISRKILGNPLALPQAEQDKILEAAIQKIRSRHKLKIQATNITSLASISNLPDFEIEAATDLPAGFLRVTTEVGSSLWDEKIAAEKIIGSS